MFKIKRCTFGKGKPVICISTTSSSEEAILKEVKSYIEDGAQMIEFRCDYFEGINDIKEIEALLEKMAAYVDKSILLFTIRTKNQGGCAELAPDYIDELTMLAAKNKAVDMVDIEYYETKDATSKIRALRNEGVKVIASHHDFNKTPDDKTIDKMLREINSGGADIVKLALMPRNMHDVLRLSDCAIRFKEEYKDQPIAIISMGKFGMILRICAEAISSCLTFAAGKSASAPGQIDYEELKQMVELINKNIN